MKRIKRKTTVIIRVLWRQLEELEKAILLNPQSDWLLKYLKEEHSKGEECFDKSFRVFGFEELPSCAVRLTVPYPKAALRSLLEEIAFKNSHLKMSWTL
jgi:hypothetical protein